MAQTKPSATAKTEPPKSFSDMNGGEKFVHVCKVLVFLVTFGFAFPTILSGD